ncbi:MAG: hypothetical protein IKX61_06900 [Prevotella sp.]|nr:hypothetical protein [Prevotella sp.]
MKNFTLMILGVFMFAASLEVKAEVDPNFHVYICFGQSNMEGNANWEKQDEGNVDSRFKMLAPCNFDNPKRTKGNWYTAKCPIVSPVGKLGPTDYFGRTMVANLPSDHKIGVIAVAMGGSPIEMFDKDKYQAKMKGNEGEWWAQLATRYYGGNPYGCIIELAKKAQEMGVIKGILLHQGCSNCGDPNWPNMVKKIYEDMLKDLGLQAEDVPLFVGEVEYQEMGGGCSGHNVQVDRMPSVVPTSYVVSAKNLPGNGTDPWHFSAAGYRVLGKRYAQQALRVIYDIDPDFEDPYLQTTAKEPDQSFTSVNDLKTTPFAIVNENEKKAFYCTFGQHLAYADYTTAFKETTSGYLFKLAKGSGGYRLKLVSPDGNDYNVGGGIGYLNTQAASGENCFISSNMNNQNGQDIEKGAIWTIDYVDGKGFTIKSVGTGKYLKDPNSPANHDEPTYFNFCTLKEATTGISDRGIVEAVKPAAANGWYTLDGRKLSEKPSQHGLYIVNGKTVVVK